MTDQEILLVMTICDLLGKSTDVKPVQDAYQRAIHKLERRKRNPTGSAIDPDEF